MNCTYHIQNQISLICRAPHKCKCQRKLCAECQDTHGVDSKYIVSIKKFRDMVNKKLTEEKLDEKQSELIKQRMNFKSVLSQTENMLKQIWEELSQSIQQIYNQIQQENNQYINLFDENANLAESSYTDLEKLVSIVEGTTFNQWNDQNKSSIIKLEKTKNFWEQETYVFSQKMKKEMKKIQTSIKIQQVQEWKENLNEILANMKDINESIFSVIIEMLKNQKISDCLGYLQQNAIPKFYEQQINQAQNSNGGKNNIKFFANIIKNIHEDGFNYIDYSTEDYKQTREVIIKTISKNKKIIQFLIFLVNLTAIDKRFIQSGSNSLTLLVQMKVDLMNYSFENIRIKNTSLVGANMVRCNLSGSQFENVDISGMNMNGAQLFDCKWKNIKINELSYLEASGIGDKSIRLWDVKAGQQKQKLEGHSGWIQSICYSPDGTTLASGCDDSSIRLWDVRTGQQLAKLDCHNSSVQQLCFSNDGNSLASGSYDKSIRFWDVRTGKEIYSSSNTYKDIKVKFKQPLFPESNIYFNQLKLIFQFFIYPNPQYFKHKVLQFSKENLAVNQELIYHHSSNLKDVAFWKPNLTLSKVRIDYYQSITNIYIFFFEQYVIVFCECRVKHQKIFIEK
ncbi:unnamed protein product [Paramecium primaurelia]|uniref:WD-40 repeat protein n=1 Tax=Paramecium primaurelia TaxID=5886 RepID=A0A8S1QPN2_PARPR|nr:unnamed protein product [Paramecium primaurelia]